MANTAVVNATTMETAPTTISTPTFSPTSRPTTSSTTASNATIASLWNETAKTNHTTNTAGVVNATPPTTETTTVSPTSSPTLSTTASNATQTAPNNATSVSSSKNATAAATTIKTLSFDGSDNAYKMNKDQPLMVRKDYQDRNPNCTLECEMQTMTFAVGDDKDNNNTSTMDLHKSLIREFLVAEERWLTTSQTNRQNPEWIAKRYNLTRRNATEYDCSASNNTNNIFEWIPASQHNTTTTTTSAIAREARIPKLVFQSWKTNTLDDEMNCHHALEWTTMNPTYDYFLFDDDAVERFLQVEFGGPNSSSSSILLKSYQCIIPGAAKIDVWRLFVIYMYGGFYIDFDSSPVVPFHEWNIPPDATVVTGNGRGCELKKPKSDPRGCPHQWALVYEEGHGILRQAILGVLRQLAERKARRTMSIAFYPYIRAFWAHANVHSTSDPRYIPGWGDEMGGRLLRDGKNAQVKQSMRKTSSHWETVDGKRGSYDKRNIWRAECLID